MTCRQECEGDLLSSNIQVIDRALDILEILSIEKDGLGVTEIGNRLALHKSTVHRIVSALAERGYIEKVPSTSVYRIGLKLVELSSVYLNSVELKTEAKPYLRELSSKYNLAAHIAILDGCAAVYIDKVDSVGDIRLYSQIGRRIPVHCSGLGKCLFSGLSDSEIEDALVGYVFTKYTANTITNIDDFRLSINESRRLGYAFDDEEHDENIRCVAAPIFDYREKIIAAISVAGPSTVISKDKDTEIGIFVKEIAKSISRRMGYKC